jgi:hypothetical protein
MPKLQEFSIDLTAQELLDPTAMEGLTEIEDICDLDELQLPADVANVDRTPVVSIEIDMDDSVEIELTAQEIDALLSALPEA